MGRVTHSIAATGILADFDAAGLVSPAGIHLERTVRRLSGGGAEPGLDGLALALVARALELGSACLPIGPGDQLAPFLTSTEPEDSETLAAREGLSWPDPDRWRAELAASPIVTSGDQSTSDSRPLRLVADQLYFERVWQQQEQLADALIMRLQASPPAVTEGGLEAALAEIFTQTDDRGQPAQRAAVEAAFRNSTSVIVGGPGTGKTTSVQRVLATIDKTSSKLQRVALAALSGKAAARMKEALDEPTHGLDLNRFRNVRVDSASTLHRLLGSRGRLGFEYGPSNPLPHDWVIVDEVSMISLPMMVQLLSSLRPSTRLILLGDPDQLSSIEVGSVLSDIVAADLPSLTTAGRRVDMGHRELDTAIDSTHTDTGVDRVGRASIVTELKHNYRFAAHPGLISLAQAVRTGDVAAVRELLSKQAAEIEFVAADPASLDLNQLPELLEDLVSAGQKMRDAAVDGDIQAALTALNSHRLLCANARGPHGVSHWGQLTERALAAAVPGWGLRADGTRPTGSAIWYPGRPLLNTSNSPELGIFNGDTGILIEKDGDLRAAMGTVKNHQLFNPYVLESAETMHALTIHKSQGSQYRAVSLILPPVGSPILTRELLYTGLTRATDRVRIVSTLEAIVAATQTPARRASGLTQRLQQKLTDTQAPS